MCCNAMLHAATLYVVMNRMLHARKVHAMWVYGTILAKLHVMVDEVWCIIDLLKDPVLIPEEKLKGNDPSNDCFGCDHDHYDSKKTPD